jgi:hypothetical protein
LLQGLKSPATIKPVSGLSDDTLSFYETLLYFEGPEGVK